MLLLILGIIVFLGVHSLPTLPATHATLQARLGVLPYKAVFSLASLAGFVLIVIGFGRYRDAAWVQLWVPPAGMRHLTILLMWFAFVSLAAMNPKPSRIKGWLRHPMLVGIKIWALAHLLANGDAGGMLLFGSFLAWAVYDRIAVKRRGDPGAPRLDHFTQADAIILAAGTIAYVAMILLHPWLIGVSVLSM